MTRHFNDPEARAEYAERFGDPQQQGMHETYMRPQPCEMTIPDQTSDKAISVGRMFETCPTCKGSGLDPETPDPSGYCSKCSGMGKFNAEIGGSRDEDSPNSLVGRIKCKHGIGFGAGSGACKQCEEEYATAQRGFVEADGCDLTQEKGE